MKINIYIENENDMTALENFNDYKNIKCFYCNRNIIDNPGEIVEGNLYMWHYKFCIQWESEGELYYFHPDCAERISLHLIKDVRRGEDYYKNLYSDAVDKNRIFLMNKKELIE